MNAAGRSLPEFMAAMTALGVEFRAEGERLCVSAPPGVVDAALAAEIAQRKPALLELFTAREGLPSADMPRVSRESPLPLGFVQQRIWLHQQLEPETVLYNLPAAWRLGGALDVPALQGALDAVLARHEVLRMRVAIGENGPTQTFVAHEAVALEVEDLSGRSDPHRALGERLNSLRDAPIDLERDAPFRLALFRLAPQDHVLFFMPHHVVWDGWSFDIFLRELNGHYRAAAGLPVQPFPQLPVQYADYAIWHRDWLNSGAMLAQSSYWLRLLEDPPPPLSLPTDFPRPPLFSHRGDWEAYEISAQTIARVHRVAAAHHATPFMVLLAAWFGFLSRLSGQRDIIVGAPVQARQVAEVTDLIGCFVNTLCLRQRLDPELPFAELLGAVRETCLQAYEHQEAPVEWLVDRLGVRRDPSRTPLFQAMFSHQQVSRRPQSLGDLSVSQVHVNPAAAPTDLMLAVMEGSSGARGVIHYSTDLFTAATARALRLRFECFLDDALASPTTRLADLQWLPQAEVQLLLHEWAAGDAVALPEPTVHALVARGARRWPDRAALYCGTQRLTHAELDQRSDALASLLRSRGAGRGQRVGLCVERSADMLVAQLAILKSGAAYVPLDPRYPPQRLSEMAGDAGLILLVTDIASQSALPWPSASTVLLGSGAESEAPHADPVLQDEALDAREADPAYVIYTSGSTGRPKGVVVPHRAVVNLLDSMARKPGLSPEDRLLAVTTLSFDISVLELLLPLTVGASVVLARRDELLDGEVLRQLAQTSAATVMQATPSMWRLLIESGWNGTPTFKALVGGEPLPPGLAAELLERVGSLWNMYGPTETTVWSTCWQVTGRQDGVAIGRPIANTTVRVLDEAGRPCPIGVPGEIYIGGCGVALGYRGRDDLTAERFVSDPLAAHDAGVLYRTGDLGRWRHDGELQHLGRLDFQVKVRGHRIELGEIESRLLRHPGVRQTIVMAREDRPGDVRLVAYVVSQGEAAAPAELRDHLRAQLPDYMLPQHFVPLDELPVFPNGKIDRARLPAPVEPASLRLGAPLQAHEQAVASIWQALLGVSDVQATDNFFDLGGHSLLAIQLSTRLQRELGLRVPARRLIFESLAQVAATRPDGAPAQPTHQPKIGVLERVRRALQPALGKAAR